jgi:LmbE family N-acetylglucosaminyl deacetylase
MNMGHAWLMIFASVLGVCCLGTAFLLLKAWSLRAGIYKYDVRTDQRYDFPQSRTSRVTARLQNGSLHIPPRTRAGGVALLELRIRSTPFGHWFEPYVEIQSARGRWRQPFERGGSGLRYVDLSQILGDGETPLRLRGRHLEISDQSVVLYYVQHDVDLEHQRILVIGTHPDDAEIAAYGVYAERDAYVITLTAGESGEPGAFARFEGAGLSLEKGRNRAWNSVTVPMLGGLSINRTANLGYFDGTLQAMKGNPETPFRSVGAELEFLDAFGQCHDPSLMESRRNRSATWSNLVADLEHLIRTIQPEIIVTPYPRLDWHPDHKMSTVALVEALKNLNWRRGSLLLYANHFCSSDRYPFGEAGDLVSLPPGVDDIYFDGIVSNTLDAKQQARKHMALDAMIDLRPVIQVDSFRSVATAFYKVLKSSITDGNINYFRQAVRANELFFEVRVSSLYETGVTERILG